MTTLIRAAALALLLCPLAAPAHGIWTHIHVTGWAIENLPEGELKALFSDPEVMNAALFAAAFTDTGYGLMGPEEQIARAYSEHTHWEPFVRDFVAWIIENDPPPWTTKESKMRVAFLMGCAAHGLQDEIFDSLFLPQVTVHDGEGQSETDPASDGFLALDGHLRFFPTKWLPMQALLELYEEALDEEVTPEIIHEAVDFVVSIYVNEQLGPIVTEAVGLDSEASLPWMRQHYLDPAVPGSLHSEILPTMHYLQAIWDRLHGDFTPDEVVTYTFPAPPRRLLGVDATTPDPWVTVLYGAGVRVDSAEATWTDDGTESVGFALKGTRWGHEWPRLHRLQPSQHLTAGAWYHVEIAAGLELIDGGETTEPVVLDFQAPCESVDDPACPDLGEIPVASIEPPAPPEPAPDVTEPGPEPVEPVAEPTVEPPPAEPAIAEPRVEPPAVAEPAVDAGAAGTPAGTSDGGCTAGSGPAPPLAVVLLLVVGLLAARRRTGRATER